MLAHVAPLAALTGLLLAYAAGVVRLWRRAGPGRGGIGIAGALAFVGGWWILVVAVAPPLDGLAHARLSAHMTQHVLLVTLGAPLLALGRPALALAWTLPGAPRRRATRWGRRVLAAAFIAGVSHAAALWLWHLPALYEAAVAHDATHALEHASLAGTAVLFWAALVDATRRSRLGAAAGYVFATGLQCTLLGALLTVAPRPWYPHYVTTASASGLTAIEDQQLAGLVMWVPAGVVLAVAGLALVAAWLREAERRVARTRVERLRRERVVETLTRVGSVIVVVIALAGCEGTRATAARMTGGDPDHGRQAIRAYGCWTCHTIPGVPGANAVVGPPLTGLAGRAFIAGVPNNPEHLVRWIRHPHEVRPSTPMPEMGVTERDGRDIAAYLYTLR
jgi:putative membrane protein